MGPLHHLDVAPNFHLLQLRYVYANVAVFAVRHPLSPLGPVSQLDYIVDFQTRTYFRAYPSRLPHALGSAWSDSFIHLLRRRPAKGAWTIWERIGRK